jgi:metal-dependent amidase/aminoacylase/carboxypeptidase family protein
MAGFTLSQARDAWKGTIVALFQPGEETAQGAQAMIDRLSAQVRAGVASKDDEKPR